MSDLATRYGAPNPVGRRLTVAVGAVLAAALLGWVAWAVVYQSNPEVESQLLAFTVPSDHGATVRFRVVRDDEQVTAKCFLQAIADDHSVVGEATVAVDNGAATQVVNATLRTERRARVVELLGCTAPGQPERR